MKKVLSFVLVVSLVLGLCSTQVVAVAPHGYVTIKSNDGLTTLYENVDDMSGMYVDVTATGATISSEYVNDTYTYTGDKNFLGLAVTANATSPDYAIGDTAGSGTYYIVESASVQAYIITGDAVPNAASYELYEVMEDLNAGGGILDIETGDISGTQNKIYTLKATSSTLYFDLTTLGLSAGSHVFVVKAKADGYLDSDYSNEVIYTVQQEYSVDGTVTNGSLRGLGEDEPATSVMAGESLTIRVVNNIDYTLPETVTVTMGGEVLTSGYTYDNETGVIVIEAVTGDIVITANCLEVAKGYTLTFDGTAYYKSSLWSGSDNLFKLNFADGTERILTLGNVETALSNKQSFSNVVSIYLYGQQDDGLSSIYTGTISPDMTGLVYEDIYVLESDVTFTYVFPD